MKYNILKEIYEISKNVFSEYDVNHCDNTGLTFEIKDWEIYIPEYVSDCIYLTNISNVIRVLCEKKTDYCCFNIDNKIFFKNNKIYKFKNITRDIILIDNYEKYSDFVDLKEEELFYLQLKYEGLFV